MSTEGPRFQRWSESSRPSADRTGSHERAAVMIALLPAVRDLATTNLRGNALRRSSVPTTRHSVRSQPVGAHGALVCTAARASDSQRGIGLVRSGVGDQTNAIARPRRPRDAFVAGGRARTAATGSRPCVCKSLGPAAARQAQCYPILGRRFWSRPRAAVRSRVPLRRQTRSVVRRVIDDGCPRVPRVSRGHVIDMRS
jgi:hypothetical protein